MVTSIPDKQKKRGRPSTGVTPMQGVRFPPDLLSKVEDWRDDQPDKPTFSEAVRQLVVIGLDAKPKRP